MKITKLAKQMKLPNIVSWLFFGPFDISPPPPHKSGYKIMNDESLYWSNEDGWVDSDSATLFSKDEMRFFNMPIGARFLEIINENGVADAMQRLPDL